MSDDWLDLELPANHEHPPAPVLSWEEYVAVVDAHQRELIASGRFARLLPNFAELHRGEPFVMHD